MDSFSQILQSGLGRRPVIPRPKEGSEEMESDGQEYNNSGWIKGTNLGLFPSNFHLSLCYDDTEKSNNNKTMVFSARAISV